MMGKQRLGVKKQQRIERLTGRKVSGAYTRGGWPHGWAEVFFVGETYTIPGNWPPMVNYHTGEFEQDIPGRTRMYSAVENVLQASSEEIGP